MSDAPDHSVPGGVASVLHDAEALYKDVHQHPELSMHEERTAALAAQASRLPASM